MIFNLIENQSEKTGLPPVSLIYVDEIKTEKIGITISDYDEAEYHEVIMQKNNRNTTIPVNRNIGEIRGSSSFPCFASMPLS